MTKFKLTDALKHRLQQSVPGDEYARMISDDPEHITHTQLVKIFEKYHPTKTLLALIKLSKLDIPNKNITAPKPKTKEYTKLMERLRLEAKEEEYKQLTQPKPDFPLLYEDKSGEFETPAQMNKEAKNHITTIFNILLSVASVSYAIWYWTDTSWKLETSYRVLLSLFFGLLVLVAEVVVYLGYLNKIEQARETERRKKEIKKVVKTIDQ